MAYDLVVIGSGPGGYVCAVRAAQLGLKVAVVEKDKTFGGTCLNVGCIPSKALLHASELYEEAGHVFDKMGIKVGKPKLDLAAMMAFKDQGVDGNVKGVAFLFKKNKVDSFEGFGRIAAPGQVEVKAADGETQMLETKAIVIATGSDVARLKGIAIDEKRIVSSTGALTLDKVPERLLVVGAGIIGLEAVGIATDERGRIVVNHNFETNVRDIFAIGDVIAGPMLAHKAEDEGVAVAEIIEGQAGHVNYDAIPNVVYTFPEIASVGKSEDELKAAGVTYNVGKFPFTANGRAKVNLTTDGFVKILADSKTDRVLGVHIVGADAGNMIAEAAIAMEFGASSEDIARTCHAHPTLPEAVKEAALAVDKRSIHM